MIVKHPNILHRNLENCNMILTLLARFTLLFSLSVAANHLFPCLDGAKRASDSKCYKLIAEGTFVSLAASYKCYKSGVRMV